MLAHPLYPFVGPKSYSISDGLRGHVSAALIDENLFLREQLAIFQERKMNPKRITNATRLAMLALAQLFESARRALVMKAETFIKPHWTAFRMSRHRWTAANEWRSALVCYGSQSCLRNRRVRFLRFYCGELLDLVCFRRDGNEFRAADSYGRTRSRLILPATHKK
jgi:hypothetical protein